MMLNKLLYFYHVLFLLTTIDALVACLCFMSLHVHCTAFYSPATEALIINNNIHFQLTSLLLIICMLFSIKT